MLWKDVIDFEGLYTVSEYGDIRSSYKSKKSLKAKSDKDGYLSVILYKDGKPKCFRVHRLVAEAFIPNYEQMPIVNHKDLNVKNNHYLNLEWCTNTHNIKHYYENKDNKRTLSSLSKDDLLDLVKGYKSGKSHKQLKVEFNLDCRADVISELVTGRRFSEITGINNSCDFVQRDTSKLNDFEIFGILHKVYNLKVMQYNICKEYGLSAAQVSRIINGTRRTNIYNKFMKQYNTNIQQE